MDEILPPELTPEDPDSIPDADRKVAGIIPFIRREERKPGDWTAEVQKEAKEKLGINVLSPNQFPEGMNNRPEPRIRGGKGNIPILFDEDIAEEICERLLCGETLSSITQDQRMPTYGTIWRWRDKFPEFKDAFDLAKKDGTHYIADDCMRIADNLDLDPSHKRVMVETRLRLIKSWNARAYADNLKVSGDDGAPPVRFFIEGLSDRVKGE